jgi:membrane fusion protein, multidrug efflux system
MPSKIQPANLPEKSSAMADPVLKFPPEHKGNPASPRTKVAAEPRRRLMAGLRRYRRFLLLVVLPLVALVAGTVFYLNGGRYVTTDDAYVGAQKVLVTPDISGKIEKVVVREGQQVNEGDVLFEIDPVPFRLAVAQAKATLDQSKTTYDNLVANIKIYGQMLDLAQQGVDLKQRDVDRKQALVKNNFGSQLDLDNAGTALVTAGAQAQFVKQQLSNAKTQLLGNPGLPLEQFPPYAQAKANLDQAERNLDHTVMRAPMAGIATQVDQIQLGRFVAAGTPVFSIIDVSNPWVDANPKESDFTYVAVGQPVTLDVDAFPNHVFKGTVGSLSPGTGAQFAILPPQNATGNFVKVVQRVPVRIYFDKNDKFVGKLKAGMSVYATIDTNHRRSLAGLLGLSSAAATHEQD